MSLTIYDRTFQSHLLLGTARYPSPAILLNAIKASGSDLITVSLRRQQSNPEAGQAFWRMLQSLGVDLLPNTAGCESVSEAYTLSQMSRELFNTNLIKLEVIGDSHTLQPDMNKTIECADKLLQDGFQVLPYCTDDLVACRELVNAGCKVIMPWGSPIGTGRGINNPHHFEILRHRLPDTIIIVDAGLGKPSHAVQAFELGADGVLINTAVAKAHDPVKIANAFRLACEAGQLGREAIPMVEQNVAVPSTPVVGMPFRF